MQKSYSTNPDTHLPAPGFIPNPFDKTSDIEANRIVVFNDKSVFDGAMQELLKKGFHTHHFTVERSRDGNLLDTTLVYASKLAEGAAFGAIFGIVFGALIAVFGNIGLEALADRPISSAIATTIASGMVFCCVGALIGVCIREYNLENYATWLQEGSILVNVVLQDSARAQNAITILVSHGGRIMLHPLSDKKIA